jgi:hypothetical protein
MEQAKWTFSQRESIIIHDSTFQKTLSFTFDFCYTECTAVDKIDNCTTYLAIFVSVLFMEFGFLLFSVL